MVLNKIQISGTFSGETVGLPGITIHGQVLRLDGHSLSDRVGDIQTADSIDARPVTRLFESWIDKKFGDDERSIAFRVGLMDLNSDFDSTQTASLFVNSSHGIGADIARSGHNGPSIYPVSSLGFRVSWLPSTKWTFRAAVFDGVPGDLARPKAFVSVKLSDSDGLLAIGQADYHLSDKAKVELGTWRYSTTVPDLAIGSSDRRHDQGAYASIEGPLPKLKGLSGWLRVGIANGAAQVVSSYIGAGIVAQGLIPKRPDDRLGFAIARAGIGALSQTAQQLHIEETSYELSYQYKIRETISVQPDMQYIEHPSAISGAKNALVVGLRIVLTAGYPRKAPAADATDPTVPPDGPQPPDSNNPAGNTSSN